MPHTHLKTHPATVGWFTEGFGKPEIDTILSNATIRGFQAREVIFRFGELANHLYLLRKGRVKFYRVSPNGQEVVLGWLMPGELFGLGTLPARALNYLGTAETLDDCEAYVWNRASILRLALRYPRLAANSLRISLHYVAQFAGRHISLASYSVEERLARTLIELGHRSGQATPGGVEVDVKNEQLASLADVGYFTTSRLLRKWQRMGAVKKSRGKVLIECPEKLLIEIP
jgi:CRP/FNR family transcriptional regulator, nitrogen oxide reductase regulator